VVYLSDHGELLGDHGLMGKQAYHYDSCIRIPMICRWDGHWPAGTRQAEIVEQTDLMATLLDAAGLPAPPQDGRSFAPLLATGALPEPRGYAYVESYHGAPEDPSQPPVTWSRTIRSDRWRVTFYPDLRVGECYDLVSDPDELHNRWHDPACREVIDHHRQLLVQRLILRDLPMPPRPYNV
jgi:arylsulfatase A-like enzyme